MSLIKEINDLRRELKIARTQIHDLEAALGLHSKKNKNEGANIAMFTTKGPSALLQNEMDEKEKMIDMQKMEIRRLRQEMSEMELGMGSRPPSGQKLQPIEMAAWFARQNTS